MQAKLRADGDAEPGTRGRVIRLAVSAAPQDRVLSDREWSQIATRVVKEFTGDENRFSWEAVRHDPRHIHVTLLQRGHDGRLLSESHDFARFGRISQGLERDYGLRRVDHSRTDTAERKRARTEGRERAAIEQRATRSRRPIREALTGRHEPSAAPPARRPPAVQDLPTRGRPRGRGRGIER